MKISIFIEHDITLRHFILNDVFMGLVDAGHDVTLVVPTNAQSRLSVVPANIKTKLPIVPIEVCLERVALWKRIFLTNVYRFDTSRHAKLVKNIYTKNMGWKGNLLLSSLSLPLVRSVYTHVCKRKLDQLQTNALKTYLDEHKPDLVVHPCVLSGVFFDELLAYTKQNNIPMITVMNSWDNPSTKQGAVNMPENLLVWGEQTYRHAIDYMRLSPSAITKFGAAQFDIYRTSPMDTPQEFRLKHGLASDCQILLYAGSSKGTSEIDHLDYIDSLIENGTLPQMKVLYRPHPWGGGGAGGQHILDKIWKNVVIERSMLDYLKTVRSGTDTIYLADYRHTHNVLSNIDFLISPLSTIILEAALHNKPAMCYLPVEETDADHLQIAKDLPHFEELFTSPTFPKAFSQKDLANGLNKLVAQSTAQETSEMLKKEADFYVEPFSRSWRERFPEYCEMVLTNHHT